MSFLIIDTIDNVSYWNRNNISAIELNNHNDRDIEVIIRSNDQNSKTIYKIWQHPNPAQLKKKFNTTKKYFQDTMSQWIIEPNTNMCINQSLIYLQHPHHRKLQQQYHHHRHHQLPPPPTTTLPEPTTSYCYQQQQQHFDKPIGPPKKPAIKRRKLSPKSEQQTSVDASPPQQDWFDEEYTV